jgi:hypothetical protein
MDRRNGKKHALLAVAGLVVVVTAVLMAGPSAVPRRGVSEAQALATLSGRLYLPMVVSQNQTPEPGPTPDPERLIFADDFDDGTLTGWTSHSGTWTNPGTWMRGEKIWDASGTIAYNVKDAGGSDLRYAGTVTLVDAFSAGLILRASNDGSENTCVVLDADDGKLKLCRDHPHWIIRTWDMAVEQEHPYRIEVVADGAMLDVYVDGVKRLSAAHDAQPGDKLGVIVENGTADFDDLEAWKLP